MTQAARSPVITLYPTKAIPPPSDWPARKKRLWREIVGAFSIDYFRSSDRRVLVAYVDALAMHADLTEALDRDGAVLIDKHGRKYANPAAMLVNQTSARIASLGTKLRIHASARTRTDAAAALANKRPSSVRPPWEMSGNDEAREADTEACFDDKGTGSKTTYLDREAAKRGRAKRNPEDEK